MVGIHAYLRLLLRRQLRRGQGLIYLLLNFTPCQLDQLKCVDTVPAEDIKNLHLVRPGPHGIVKVSEHQFALVFRYFVRISLFQKRPIDANEILFLRVFLDQSQGFLVQLCPRKAIATDHQVQFIHQSRLKRFRRNGQAIVPTQQSESVVGKMPSKILRYGVLRIL